MATEEETGQEATDSAEGDKIGDAEEGVLLYYKFVQILEAENIKRWLFELSNSLGLLGRIRVAHDGVNVTVGGKMKALREHINLVGANPLFEGTDFKLASSVPNVNRTIAADCGFTSLSARIVKELVTLGLPITVEPPSLLMAGKHVTSQEFHKILQDSGMLSEANSWSDSALGGSGVSLDNAVDSRVSPRAVTDDGTETRDEASVTMSSKDHGGTVFPKKLVVLDARNIYETRIGRFCAPKGVQVMDPKVRQYSDLPKWIDDHEDQLRNNQILMYCTGGVRCEMASAYIRSKGKEFEDVSQLSGGIQRYLEAFSDGGFFTGKNFVFDHRLAVSSSNKEVVGSCLLCSSAFDDYSYRCRCSSCRMLVLICTACQVSGSQEYDGPKYLCELCSGEKMAVTPRRRIGSQKLEERILCHEPEISLSESRDEVQKRKLKILCLHGFRQSASSLKGRLNALRKKLRQQAEFVYVDAPHEVLNKDHLQTSVTEEIVRNAQASEENPHFPGSNVDETTDLGAKKFSKKFAWLVSPEIEAGDSATLPPVSFAGEAPLFTRCDVPGARPGNASTTMGDGMIKKPDFWTKSEDYDGTHRNSATASSSLDRVGDHSLGTGGRASDSTERLGSRTKIPQSAQYLTQTDGWSRSWIHLKLVFTELGPFDGVLGFSQGAAVAAALCSRRRAETGQHAEVVSFKFAILCSGFFSPAVEHPETPIDCPSLHIFGGSSGHDRQIGVHESEKLSSLFQPDNRMLVRHNMGHIVPTQPEYLQQYVEFLSQFKL